MPTPAFSILGPNNTRRDYAADGTRVWGAAEPGTVIQHAVEPRLVDGVRAASAQDRVEATEATQRAHRLEQLRLLDALRALVQAQHPGEVRAVFTAERWHVRHRETLAEGTTTTELLAALAEAQALLTQGST